VPEERKEYARLFESYCHEVIGDVLDRTDLENPYAAIKTPLRERPRIQNQGNKTVAFVVHNLAREYTANYIFSNDREDQVRIALSGKIFSSEVGSYATQISLQEDGALIFERESYTIWQNSAKNPYTALMAPVEETLHILVRVCTEGAMRREMERKGVSRKKEVKEIADEWIAVEEAVVGGLVYELFPDILRTYIPGFSDSLIRKDLATKSKMNKYRYLKQGIEVVSRRGPKQILKLYRGDPALFKALLVNNAL
jgi:hypothetical protein